MYQMKGDEIRVSNIPSKVKRRRSGLFRRIREARNGDESDEKREEDIF